MSFSSNIPAAGRAETISELIKNMIDISFSSEAIFFSGKLPRVKSVHTASVEHHVLLIILILTVPI